MNIAELSISKSVITWVMTILMSLLTGLVLTYGRSYDPPDCYPEVVVGPTTYGGVALLRQNSYAPEWALAFRVSGTSGDEEGVSFRIVDKDVSENDYVGVWETTVGHLVHPQGRRILVLFDEDVRLQAGGILALDVEVRLVD